MKILLATDGSSYSLAAAKKCCQMLRFDDKTTIRILSVSENIDSSPRFALTDRYLEVAKKTARRVAENAVEETKYLIRKTFDFAEVDIETKTIFANPKEAVIQEAEDWKADLIVVGSHGRGFLGRMLLGSVSSAVVHHAQCSVLVVRANKSEIEEFEKSED